MSVPDSELDPFEVLGLDRNATLDDVRAARRRLAFDRHPDRGGSAEGMRDLNSAFDAAVADLMGRRPLRAPAPPRSPTPTTAPGRSPRTPRGRWTDRVEQDVPSFVIDALPAEAFEALLIVTSWIGEVLVDDPPYVLEAHLYEPSECWCRLDLVPDAGACTISLTVAPVDDTAPPLLDDVRDVWVRQLNQPGAFVDE
ncbi:MAG: J domain-containing protein [Ilumatobacteraceae bacterium]